MPTGAENVRSWKQTGSEWSAVKVTRLTHKRHGRPPKIFHSTGPDVFQVSSLDSYTASVEPVEAVIE
jgi:hypothetical protein